MFKELKSRNQQPIASFNEKLLCSSVDPVAEAEKWFVQRATMFRHSRVVIVLGLGCGYHVLELQKKYPGKRILVIEKNSQCHSFFKKKFPIESESLEFVVGRPSGKILSSDTIVEAIKEFYTLCRFEAACAVDGKYYDIIQRKLTGRDLESFTKLASIRGLSELYFNDNKLRALKSEAISIKTMYEGISNAELNENQKRDRALINALRELVL